MAKSGTPYQGYKSGHMMGRKIMMPHNPGNNLVKSMRKGKKGK